MNDIYETRCKTCSHVYINNKHQKCCGWLNKPIDDLRIREEDDCDYDPNDELKMNMEDGEIL